MDEQTNLVLAYVAGEDLEKNEFQYNLDLAYRRDRFVADQLLMDCEDAGLEPRS